MGQLLRVAAWLRFASQSQLTKGLEGFAKHEAPGFFEARQWAVRQLDARLCLESELPGDFSDVEAPFIEMFRAARWGYIDYFEEGNDRRQGDSRDPVKRWSCHNVPRRWWLSMASVVLGTGR